MEAKPAKFLHGTLEVSIFDATPYAPRFPFNILQWVLTNLWRTGVRINIDNQKVAETSYERDRLWNQTFQILCAHPADSVISIEVRRRCYILGKLQIPAKKILNEESLINGFFPMVMENGKPNKELKLRFMLWFKPAELEPTWRKIVCSGGFQGLRNATFPQRTNCRVTFYQDAHQSAQFNPPVASCGSPRKLWEDVYKAIDGARHLIYITGWSLNPKIILVRDPQTDIPLAVGVTLGQLLRRKAEEGVAVRILLWDDETSVHFIKNQGVMNTHDEDAFEYFKLTNVVCKLCPRIHHQFPTLFSHHQKTVTVDTESHDSSFDREIMSFVGGLDLCEGRYDTQQHSPFHTLNTESHSHDFYQTSIPGATLQRGGPRQPWHDVHARIVGEAARDVLANFEQRWTKQCEPSLLIPTNSIPNLRRLHLFPPKEMTGTTTRNWNVQVFRSIDHVSATQLPKNLHVEQSIQEAYVEAIRRAERFIYIENQYFIGGCHLWKNDRHSGCRNLIPVEIALKIVSKIRVKERFAVYIVIPMWPEGAPESETVQDILHWSRETMAMMYKLVGDALKECGEAGQPRDYLNFFCLANREKENKHDSVPRFPPNPSTQYWNAQKYRRFMVYVHSKLMIVDDLYIIIGSANINQRSMDGQRDTEIAIGSYQPQIGEKKTEIQQFRMSLWYEHTRLAEKVSENPESIECVQKMCAVGDEMWRVYSDDEVVDMEGVHLVTYPVAVTTEGLIEELADCGNRYFPDTKMAVKGRKSKILPPIFTT